MHADLTKVRQCLFNLLSNAAKFSHQGMITLEADRQAGEGGEWIAFRVTDTGIGMTPEQKTRVFQPFTQADASSTRRYGGTGLGLTITKRFCEIMAGEITFESEIGHGTTFTIKLPADVSAAREADRPAVGPAAPEPAPPPPGAAGRRGSAPGPSPRRSLPWM
jgi:signal transduction histidine kinase